MQLFISCTSKVSADDDFRWWPRPRREFPFYFFSNQTFVESSFLKEIICCGRKYFFSAEIYYYSQFFSPQMVRGLCSCVCGHLIWKNRQHPDPKVWLGQSILIKYRRKIGNLVDAKALTFKGRVRKNNQSRTSSGAPFKAVPGRTPSHRVTEA